VLSGLQSVSCNVYIADFRSPRCTLYAPQTPLRVAKGRCSLARTRKRSLAEAHLPAKIDRRSPAGGKERIGMQWGEKGQLRCPLPCSVESGHRSDQFLALASLALGPVGGL
jgi:hypothetical protein